jgi:hypothetical protein
VYDVAPNLNPDVETSLSVMVSVAFGRTPSLAPPVGLLRRRYPVSLPSAAVSLTMPTVNVLLATPGPKVNTPPAAVKSAPSAAVLEAAPHVTATVPVVSPVRDTVTVFEAVASPTEKSTALKSRVGGV